jgi:hypothetical protein
VNAVEVLSRLRSSGVTLAVDAAGKLHVRGGKDVIATLREDIKAHKAGLVAILEEERRPTPGPEEPLNQRVALAAVKRGKVARVVSATLGESVYWVRDEETAERIKRAPDYGGEVCYTLVEITKLRGQSAEMLRAVHEFKRELGAALLRAEKDGYPSEALGPVVRCGDCQHFQRIDHPHMGTCARWHGRFYLWDRDGRRCKDFLNQAEGDKAVAIEDLIDRLTDTPM